jgi:DNA (cytosine-5)-methyltransferase 1
MGKVKKIKLLDLCCKAGGCSMGYFQAAADRGLQIEITGIDIDPQKNYPFKFIKADAVEYLGNNYNKYTHVHASPPCQPYSNSTAQYRKEGKIYHDILLPLQKLMYDIALPGVIENVPNAPIRADIVLMGHVFGLHVLRKRHFENVNWFMMNPMLSKPTGQVKTGEFCSVFGKASYGKVKGGVLPNFKKNTIRETWAYAMGIDWYMKDIELSEAIPPAYTRYIGNEFLKV